MKQTYRLVVLALMAGLFLNTPVLADPPPGKGNPNKSNQGNNGQGQGQGKDKQQNSSQDPSSGLITAGITVATARSIAQQTGVSGYASLPPGIAKNLARGKPLPPGIAKKTVPAVMLTQLPYYAGYEWQVAGADLILVAVGTAIVADILLNVFQ